jgi:hypothetical protein
VSEKIKNVRLVSPYQLAVATVVAGDPAEAHKNRGNNPDPSRDGVFGGVAEVALSRFPKALH